MLTPFKEVFSMPPNGVGLMTDAVTGKPKLGGPGTIYKMFIPSLMAKIAKGASAKKSLGSPNRAIFINDSSCKPQITSIMRSQNYLSVPMAASNSWDHHHREKKVNETVVEYLNRFDRVEVTIPNGKVSKAMFNTTIYMKDY